jgi:hypothetical protein
VDRGSWIEDPKCPVLPGIRSPRITGTKNKSRKFLI